MSMPHILLVDDVSFFLELQKGFLKQTPATLETATNGKQALEAIARRRPDLIILDNNMPVMDGLTCCRILKADPLLRAIPVMMVTAANSDQELEPCRLAGADGVLSKPIDRKAFLALGHSLLFHVNRRDRRMLYQGEVMVRKGGEVFSAMAVNISERGIYLHCRRQIELQERLELIFNHGGQTFDMVARVAWLNAGFPRTSMDLPPGFGLEFRPAKVESVQMIKRLLQSLEPTWQAG
jgi:two-component system, cell cycle response regulator